MAPPVGEAAQGHGDVIAVSVPADAQAADVARAMAEAARRDGVPCRRPVFVWGSLRELADARPMRVSAQASSLAGFLVCEADLPSFLAAQKDSPRLRGQHGGSCSVRFADGQLYMRRASSDLGEAALGDLSADTTEVLQKGELLAAIFDPLAAPPEKAADAGPVLTVLARVPKFFLFGMWPLPAV